MKVSKKFTTVTLFSKLLAMALFIALPIATLMLGIHIGQKESVQTKSLDINQTFSPSPNIRSSATPSTSTQNNINSYTCLPTDLKLSYIVYQKPNSGNRLTLAEKLKAEKANCKQNKLIDASSKEIYFYRESPKFCQGTPVEDYAIRKQAQTNEMTNLNKTYDVIEVTCNPDGKSSA